MLTMYKQITIKTLHKQGLKQATIATQIGCHRHTVANVLNREGFIEKQSRSKGSLFDPYQSQIEEQIEKDISILRQFEILTQNYGVRSAYVNLCKYIQARFPKQKEAFGVQVTAPGEVAELDFGYLGMFPGPLGTLVKTYGFVVVLLYSRLGFYAITYDQKLETLIHELENAFSYFSGVPKRLKVDNMKTATLGFVREYGNEAADYSYQRKIRDFLKPDMLIPDELGYRSMAESTVEDFFEIVSKRYEKGSIIITGKKPIHQWDSVFVDKTLTTAVVDRLIHHCTLIEIKGESYRVKKRQ